ncbi:hypothetical protein OCAE111667_08495 [Occultella aeris]|uniref:Uncharacterized protein n=1 Tax=Occultella aeris TaxID=2761496 RepID=A0A7M4DK76_9MICO|nr:hypothetical protein [Occultella aeris]VZO37468.1 hypothetical protein HALOF300_02539 [Occultella aeris]
MTSRSPMPGDHVFRRRLPGLVVGGGAPTSASGSLDGFGSVSAAQ